MPQTVRIGTRGSPLALAQANYFADRIKAATSGLETSIHPFTTTGDKILDKPLQDAGGKGLFTKELDRAQELNEIDLAVHSLKDVTVTLPEHLYLAAFLPREDPHDCLIGPWARIADLPHGAVVGTSSIRRKSQLLAKRPDLKAVTFRGNVQTRLRKLSEGEAQATILAAAGLRRLGMIDRAAGIIPVEDMLPSGGQGIIGVTLRKDAPEWLKAAVGKTDDEDAHLAAVAERAFLRRLDGSCRTPIAAHLKLTANGAEMAGEVLSDEGDRCWRAEGRLPHRPGVAEAERFGLSLAEEVAAKREKDLGRRMTRVLVTRSQPGASETGERLAVLGLRPIVEPVFAVETIDASLPAFDALAFTSANGVREFARREARRDVAVFCVGGRTAEAARQTGFANVTSADGDVWTLARLILSALPSGQKLLHSGNEDSVGDLVGQLRSRDIAASFLATYRAAPVGKPGPVLAAQLAGTPAFDAVLVHSARGASILAGFLKAASRAAPVNAVAMSQAAGEPLRGIARRIEIAAQPNEAELLKALTVLCDLG